MQSRSSSGVVSRVGVDALIVFDSPCFEIRALRLGAQVSTACGSGRVLGYETKTLPLPREVLTCFPVHRFVIGHISSSVRPSYRKSRRVTSVKKRGPRDTREGLRFVEV